MVHLHIKPSHLQGDLAIPPSKSHTLRAILFAALADGLSHIEHFLPSPDTQAMIEAVRLLGAEITLLSNTLQIRGFAGKPRPPDNVIDCGNSGIVLRFIGAIAALIPHHTILTGDHSIRYSRPVKPLLGALQQLGVFATSSRGDHHAPILIRGPFLHKTALLTGEDSQPVSGLLIAGAFAPHPIELHVTNPGEKPWIDLTLHWFQKLHIPYRMQHYTSYRTEGSAHVPAFTYTVPGDLSTAAFPLAAALLTHSPLTLHNIDMSEIQGDKAIIPLLQQMGARFLIDTHKQTLTIEKSPPLKGISIDLNNLIDALPILAVIGCFATGRTELTNAAIARKKESDRISCIARELSKMGARIEEQLDGLIIHHSPLHGAELQAHHDHRIALSLAVAALAAKGPSTLHGIECIHKTYPSFVEDLRAVGASLVLL